MKKKDIACHTHSTDVVSVALRCCCCVVLSLALLLLLEFLAAAADVGDVDSGSHRPRHQHSLSSEIYVCVYEYTTYEHIYAHTLEYLAARARDASPQFTLIS